MRAVPRRLLKQQELLAEEFSFNVQHTLMILEARADPSPFGQPRLRTVLYPLRDNHRR